MNAALLSAGVFLGAGLGGVLRFGLSVLALRWLGAGFPIGTLIINVLGSFVMGAVVAWFSARSGGQDAAVSWQTWRVFLTTGVLGGFTTFSAFSLEVVQLYQRGAQIPALAYVLASVVLSVVALKLGMMLAQ